MNNSGTVTLSANDSKWIFEKYLQGERITVESVETHTVFTGVSGSLWKAALQDAEGSETILESKDSKRFVIEKKNEQEFVLCWGFDSLEVECLLSAHSEKNRIEMRFSARVFNTKKTLHWLKAPILNIELSSEYKNLVIPQMAGLLIRNPSSHFKNPFRLLYPGNPSMQFLSLDKADNGLFYGCLDPDGCMKSIEIENNGTGLSLGFTHYFSYEAGQTEYQLSYPVVFEIYKGNWVKAGHIYREWAQKQKWSHPSKTAEWLKNLDLWIWNRGFSESVLPPIIKLQEELQCNVAVDWYWWHHCAYDAGFPEYFPPREGSENFKRALQDARDHDIRTQVYVNARLWGTNTESWLEKGAASSACKDIKNNNFIETYTVNKDPLAVMCPSTKFWQDSICEITQTLAEDYSLDGVYLDCIAAAFPRECHDKTHGHPTGGGHFWTDGYRYLLENIRKESAKWSHSPIITTESCTECYLDQLDAVLLVDGCVERYGWFNEQFENDWEMIPLFQIVYHDLVLSFGSGTPLVPKTIRDPLWNLEDIPQDSHVDSFSEEAILELTRNFLWGNQPMLANVTEEDLEREDCQKVLGFLKSLIQLRRKYSEFLRDGELLDIPEIETETVDIPCSVKWLYSRGNGINQYVRTVPAVLSSEWKDMNGNRAVFLVNVTGTNRMARVKINNTWRPIELDGLVCKIMREGDF